MIGRTKSEAGRICNNVQLSMQNHLHSPCSTLSINNNLDSNSMDFSVSKGQEQFNRSSILNKVVNQRDIESFERR